MRRRYGSGSLIQRGGSWVGQWRVDGKKVFRTLGKIRQPGTREGLTEKQAEKKLHELMATYEPPRGEAVRLTVAAKSHFEKRQLLGRKEGTVQDYRGHFKIHIEPVFGERDVRTINRKDIERFRDRLLKDPSRFTGKPLAVKSVRNVLSVFHAILEHAVKEEWIPSNPAKHVEWPEEQPDDDLKFLNLAELDRLIQQVPDDDLGNRLERRLYLFGAMTGLRQGECLGLRWRDIDWSAMKIRVYKNFTRSGGHGTPKSRRGSRWVPMAEKVARELELHFQQSVWQEDSDLVFCHPATGKPYDRSKLLKRFKAALRRDKIGEFEEREYLVGRGKNRKKEKRMEPILTFHSLRHTFGTTMAAAGVPMRTLQEWMGHEDIKTTLRYSHYSPGHREAELVNAAFARDDDDGGASKSLPIVSKVHGPDGA